MQDVTTTTVDYPLQLMREDIDATVLSFLDDIAGGTNEEEPFSMLARILKRCR